MYQIILKLFFLFVLLFFVNNKLNQNKIKPAVLTDSDLKLEDEKQSRKRKKQRRRRIGILLE